MEALEWDSIPNMLYGLKDGKEVLKMCVSALKSECWNFAKFGKNLQKGWKATGVRLLHHPSWAGWNFLKFQKVQRTPP